MRVLEEGLKRWVEPRGWGGGGGGHSGTIWIPTAVTATCRGSGNRQTLGAVNSIEDENLGMVNFKLRVRT